MSETYSDGTDFDGVDGEGLTDPSTIDPQIDDNPVAPGPTSPADLDPSTWYADGTSVELPYDVCCSSAPVEMAPDTAIQWTAPITVNLDGQIQTLGTPNVDLDGDGQAETFTGQDGGSVVFVTDADADGNGESMAVYNSAGQLTAALVLDIATGQWQPALTDAYEQTLTDSTSTPPYDLVTDDVATAPSAPTYAIIGGPDAAAPVITTDAAPAPTTAIIGPADYSDNPGMILFNTAYGMSQRAAYDTWAMAYGNAPVPSDNPAVVFGEISTDPAVSPELRQAASTWLDTINAQTLSIIEGM